MKIKATKSCQLDLMAINHLVFELAESLAGLSGEVVLPAVPTASWQPVSPQFPQTRLRCQTHHLILRHHAFVFFFSAYW